MSNLTIDTINCGDIISKGPWVDVRAFGAKGDGVTDDTNAIQKAFNSGRDWFLPPGNYLIRGQITIPHSFYGHKVFGYGSEYIQNVRFICETYPTFICNAPAVEWLNIGFYSKTTIKGTNDCFIDAYREGNVADIDLVFRNCSFTGLPYCVKAKGRNVTFEKCLLYLIEKALLKVDFVANPSGDSNPVMFGYDDSESGMRGFIFRENRIHYSKAYLLENNGTNASNITGVQIVNNFLEAGMIVKGVLKDAVVSGNEVFQLSTPESIFNCIKIKNVTVAGNVFKGEDAYHGLFETLIDSMLVCPDVENLTFVGNEISNIRGSTFLFSGTSQKVNISNNNARRISTVSGSYVTFIGTTHTNITIKDTVETPERSGWIAINKGSSTVVQDYDIDLQISGTLYDRLHGLDPASHSANYTNKSNGRSGMYTGNGAGSRLIDVKYKPTFFRVMTADGATHQAKSCDSSTITNITLGFYGATVGASLNTSGVDYYWECY